MTPESLAEFMRVLAAHLGDLEGFAEDLDGRGFLLVEVTRPIGGISYATVWTPDRTLETIGIKYQ